MSTKLLWGLLISAALVVPGAAMADAPKKFKNYGQCVSYFNTKHKGPQNPEKRKEFCEDFKPGKGENGDHDDKDKNGKNGDH
jgi:hypothetical protein